MSITYSFQVATERTVDEIRALLGVTASGAFPDAYGRGQPAYVLVKSVDGDPVEDALFRSAYGFAPRVAVTVELDKNVDDEETQERPAIAIMRRLLLGLTDDMYANYLGDYPVLVRCRGALSVDGQWVQQRPWFARVLGRTYAVAELADPYAEPAQAPLRVFFAAVARVLPVGDATDRGSRWATWPVPHLQDVITVRNGEVTHEYPQITMSLDYTFYLAVADSPESVRGRVLDAARSVGVLPRLRMLNRDALAGLRVTPVDYQPTRDMFAESFGFVPTVQLAIPVDESAPWAEGQARGGGARGGAARRGRGRGEGEAAAGEDRDGGRAGGGADGRRGRAPGGRGAGGAGRGLPARPGGRQTAADRRDRRHAFSPFDHNRAEREP